MPRLDPAGESVVTPLPEFSPPIVKLPEAWGFPSWPPIPPAPPGAGSNTPRFSKSKLGSLPNPMDSWVTSGGG